MSDTTHDQSSGTKPSGLRSYALAGYRWLVLAFLLAASRATVGLSCSDGNLQFTVTDDGTGFDTATTRHGTGLQGMADRLAALGGALHVRSRPGEGTTLSGELPVSALGQVRLSQPCA